MPDDVISVEAVRRALLEVSPPPIGEALFYLWRSIYLRAREIEAELTHKDKGTSDGE